MTPPGFVTHAPWVVSGKQCRLHIGREDKEQLLQSYAPSALNTALALALRHAIWRKNNPEWIVSGIPEQLYVKTASDACHSPTFQVYDSATCA